MAEDRSAEGYDGRYESPYHHGGIASTLLDLVRTRNLRRVLEVGCGTGHWLRGTDNTIESQRPVKSAMHPSFLNAYRSLRESTKKSARKSHKTMGAEPVHPSLRFKCVNTPENIWSVRRITRGYRALGVLDEDTVTWFWIGSHDDYTKAFS